MSQTRRLAAILAGDVAGYSRLMGLDEEGTHERLRADLRQLVEPKISEHKRRIVKNTDDGVLAEFARVVDVVGRGGVDGGLHRHSFAVDQGVDQICTTSGSAPLSRTEARPRSVGVKSVARDVGDPVAAHARSPLSMKPELRAPAPLRHASLREAATSLGKPRRSASGAED